MDDKELEEWLRGKPKRVGMVIASRASVRVFPNVVGDFERRKEKLPDKYLDDYLLRLCECSLVAALCAVSDDRKPPQAAKFATDFARKSLSHFAFRGAYSAADYSAHSIILSASFEYIRAINRSSQAVDLSHTKYDVWSEVESDMKFLERSKEADWPERPKLLMGKELFSRTNENWMKPGEPDFPSATKNLTKERVNEINLSGFEKISVFAKRKSGAFNWWAYWLKALHDGTFRDWDLAQRIGTEIPERTWKQGAKAVAEKIQEFQDERGEHNTAKDAKELSPEQRQARNEFAKIIAEALASAPTLSRVRAQSQAKRILSFYKSHHNQIIPEDDEYPSLMALQALGVSFESIADLLAEIERLRAENKSLSDKNHELVEKIEGHLDKISDLKTELAKLRFKKSKGTGIFKATMAFAFGAGVWVAKEAIEIDPFFHITPKNESLEISISIRDQVRALEDELCMWEDAIISCELLEGEEKSETPPSPPPRPSTE